mmetsp:Transcript_4311/g.15953  ORF Transcript_4311/g.15953 Transcript_4311/m.15953 type:complete len:492 (+) Transcript_4311:5586-7061(+)
MSPVARTSGVMCVEKPPCGELCVAAVFLDSKEEDTVASSSSLTETGINPRLAEAAAAASDAMLLPLALTLSLPSVATAAAREVVPGGLNGCFVGVERGVTIFGVGTREEFACARGGAAVPIVAPPVAISRPASRSFCSSATSFESRSATIARYSFSARDVILSLRCASASANRASTNRRPSAALTADDVAIADAAITAASTAAPLGRLPAFLLDDVVPALTSNACRSCSTTRSFNFSSSFSSVNCVCALRTLDSAFSALASAALEATPRHRGVALASSDNAPSACIAAVSARAVCARDCASRSDARNAPHSASDSRRSELALAAKASLSRALAAAISARAPSRAAFAAAKAASRAPASSAVSSSSSETRALKRSVSSRATCASRESFAASSEAFSFVFSCSFSTAARVTSASRVSATSKLARSSTACAAAASALRLFAARLASKLRSVSFAAHSSRVTPTRRAFSVACSFVLFSSVARVPRIMRPTTSDSK